eukprot:scaffold7.g3607.t1
MRGRRRVCEWMGGSYIKRAHLDFDNTEQMNVVEMVNNDGAWVEIKHGLSDSGAFAVAESVDSSRHGHYLGPAASRSFRALAAAASRGGGSSPGGSPSGGLSPARSARSAGRARGGELAPVPESARERGKEAEGGAGHGGEQERRPRPPLDSGVDGGAPRRPGGGGGREGGKEEEGEEGQGPGADDGAGKR